jgi:hypothetical protein
VADRRLAVRFTIAALDKKTLARFEAHKIGLSALLLSFVVMTVIMTEYARPRNHLKALGF